MIVSVWRRQVVGLLAKRSHSIWRLKKGFHLVLLFSSIHHHVWAYFHRRNKWKNDFVSWLPIEVRELQISSELHNPYNERSRSLLPNMTSSGVTRHHWNEYRLCSRNKKYVVQIKSSQKVRLDWFKNDNYTWLRVCNNIQEKQIHIDN